MAHSVPAPLYRPTVPDSPEKASLHAAVSDGEVKALLEGDNRNKKLLALAFVFGGPPLQDIAPFAEAFDQIRTKWLRSNASTAALQTFMYRKLADAIGLNSQQRSLLDFLAQCPSHEPTMRHIVRTVSAIRVCSDLVQYEDFDSAWRCAMENEATCCAFAAKLKSAMSDYVGDRRGMDKSNAEVELRGAVALQLRDNVSTGLQQRCRSVIDIDRKLTTVCKSVLTTQQVLKALDHAWGGDAEPPFDFVFSFRQAMNAEADGVDASLLRPALQRHLVGALPSEFGDDYALVTSTPDETENKVAVLKLVKDWLDDPTRWQRH
ncbi:MAG: hypothetical protein JWR21_1205 [Herminiimonas sp.]|nr:hypothetical protein [Herminiimonas sp.]MDB5856135.1 hypothetical protein [Herminiimonas sp.]